MLVVSSWKLYILVSLAKFGTESHLLCIKKFTKVLVQSPLGVSNREEKSLRHVAMEAKFLDDNKPIKSLTCKSLSHYFKLHRSYSISFNLANLFFGTISVYSDLSLEKESDNFCVVLIYSIKQACEIGTFHVVVVQRRQRNVQNNVHGTCKVVVCQHKHIIFCRRLRRWFCCHAEMVLPW